MRVGSGDRQQACLAGVADIDDAAVRGVALHRACALQRSSRNRDRAGGAAGKCSVDRRRAGALRVAVAGAADRQRAAFVHDVFNRARVGEVARRRRQQRVARERERARVVGEGSNSAFARAVVRIFAVVPVTVSVAALVVISRRWPTPVAAVPPTV